MKKSITKSVLLCFVLLLTNCATTKKSESNYKRIVTDSLVTTQTDTVSKITDIRNLVTQNQNLKIVIEEKIEEKITDSTKKNTTDRVINRIIKIDNNLNSISNANIIQTKKQVIKEEEKLVKTVNEESTTNIKKRSINLFWSFAFIAFIALILLVKKTM